ncbi:restriction endonuclease [Brevibacillus brevis]|uniref:restriction endonuclease n=1 Tax=Brevibacillus brevis TaxID=1393 RepID=UPI0025A5043B|nr:restriction endonuclease [Brevibacillus brevis]WJQ82599.1 restriction endonuclease [Brevibacillus brevis]
MAKWSKKAVNNLVFVINTVLIISSVSIVFHFNLGMYYFFGSLLGSVLISTVSNDTLLTADIDTLSGTDFEHLMESYYRDNGYQVERVGGSGDHEVDMILQDKKGYKIAVQCKRWKKNVGNDIVLRLKAGKQIYGCYDAWIVTTSHFTKAAIQIAEPLNIKLINGAQVHDMINRWRKDKLKNR